MAKSIPKSNVLNYFTPHRVMLLLITIFLIFLFAYYNLKYINEKKNNR